MGVIVEERLGRRGRGDPSTFRRPRARVGSRVARTTGRDRATLYGAGGASGAEVAMKFVLLGTLSPDWLGKQEDRTDSAKAKLEELGITLDAVYYTQGHYDFVDLVDAPDAEAMLAFSVWYATTGFGKIETLPAYGEADMRRAIGRL
jgi:uncharacterized protein with GYD domain